MTKRALIIVATLIGAVLPLGSVYAKPAKAKPVKVPVNFIDATGVGKPAGTITISETADGITLALALKGLPPGEHGFHLHEKASCAPGEKDGKPAAGIGAGAHFDPDATKAHKGPGGGGHKGDLPKLTVDDKGNAKEKLKVAGLKLEDVAGKAIMIHEGGDNYSDAPAPLGGGGARIACGVIPGGEAAAPAAAPAK
jgi:superoxide dismutase, Cu-Zn family